MSEIYIIGAGAQGRVACEIFQAAKKHEKLYFVDDHIEAGKKINGIQVIGNMEHLKKVKNPKVHIGVGQPDLKKKIAERLWANGISNFVNAIHPFSMIAPSAVIGKGIVVSAGAIINTNAVIEDFVLINTGAIIEHDCHISKWTTVAPGACIGGRVFIDELAFIGSRSVILARVRIGKASIIGMGAVVTKDIPDSILAYGTPAKPIRTIDNSFDWSKVL